MSTNESTSEQGCKSIESASVTTTKPVAIVNNGKDFVLNISEEFAEIYKLCYSFMETISKPNKEEIKDLSSRMDILYHDIINAKNTKTDEIVTLAESYLFLSYRYLYENDEEIFEMTEFSIMKCMELLKERELDYKCIITAVDAYQYLGIFHRKKYNKELSLSAYNKAIQLYLTYTREDETYPAPYNIISYFKNTHLDSKDILDEKITVNIKALLNWYANSDTYTSTEREHLDKITSFQHKILKKKLNNLSSSTNYFVWAVIAGSLSEYFVTCHRFTEARDHLAVASFVLKKFNEYICKEKPNSTKQFEYATYKVNITKYWAKYGIQLLRLSKKEILSDTQDKCALCNLNSLSLARSEEEFNKLLIFANMRENLKEFTNTITDMYVSSYTDANTIFEIVMKFLNEAKTSYICHESEEIYVKIILDISQIYKYFAFYVNRANKLMLYEQRLTILVTTLEVMLCKFNIRTWSIFCETIIAVNDTLDMMCENCQIQSNQRKVFTVECIKEIPIGINKILKKCLKICKLHLYISK